jgi:hypothetical protein
VKKIDFSRPLRIKPGACLDDNRPVTYAGMLRRRPSDPLVHHVLVPYTATAPNDVGEPLPIDDFGVPIPPPGSTLGKGFLGSALRFENVPERTYGFHALEDRRIGTRGFVSLAIAKLDMPHIKFFVGITYENGTPILAEIHDVR